MSATRLGVVIVMASIAAVPGAAFAADEDRRPPAACQPQVARHAIDGDPLAAVVGRYALTYQHMPASRVAVAVTGWYQASRLPLFDTAGLLGLGGEIALRSYAGSRHLEGLFVSAGAVLGYHTTPRTGWFASYGGAVDVGWSFLFGAASIGRVNGKVHVAIATGIQLLASDADRADLVPLARRLVGAGPSPRLSIVVGHAN